MTFALFLAGVAASSQGLNHFDPSYGLGGFDLHTLHATGTLMEGMLDSSGNLRLVGICSAGTDSDVGHLSIDSIGRMDRNYGHLGSGIGLGGVPWYWEPSIGAAVGPDGALETVLGRSVRRFLPNGDLDPDFGTNGEFVHMINNTPVRYLDVKVLDNGKTLLIGTFMQGLSTDLIVSRLDVDGSLDPTFANAGVLVLPLLNGLKSIVDVREDHYVVADRMLYGIDTSGVVFPGFGDQGILDVESEFSTAPQGQFPPYRYVAQSDGRIVVCDDDEIKRFLADGSGLDPVFLANAPGVLNNAGTYVQPLPDGGYARLSSTNDLTKMDSLGMVDTDFGSNGSIELGAFGTFVGLAEDASRGIVVLGVGDGSNWGWDAAVAVRVGSDGVLDTTFGQAGVARYVGFGNSPDLVSSVSVNDLGRVYMATHGSPVNSLDVRPSVVLALKPSGVPDSAFGSGGMAAGAAFEVFGLVATDTGVVVGYVYPNPFAQLFAFAHFDVNGRFLDSTGVDPIGFQGLNNYEFHYAKDMVQLPGDGAFAVIGWAWPFNSAGDNGRGAIVKYHHSNNSLDTTFGIAGGWLTPDTAHFMFERCALDPDNNIVVLGGSGEPGDPSFGTFLMKFDTMGVPVTSFGNSGYKEISFVAADYVTQFSEIMVRPDGRVVLAPLISDSLSTSRTRLYQFTSSGDPDMTFGSGGYVTLDDFAAPLSNPKHHMVLYPDSALLHVGINELTRSLVFHRVLPNGQLDQAFGSNGRLEVGDSSLFRFVGASLVLDANGETIVTGCLELNTTLMYALDAFVFRLEPGLTLEINGVEGNPVSLTVFPNPVVDRIHVRLTDFMAGEVECLVFDANGAVVERATILQPASTGHVEHLLQLNGHLAPGVYVLTVRNGPSIATTRFIVGK